MAKAATHRAAIVRAAAKLFRRNGYAATGLADILALSEAPRGSFYHYFPGGKIDVARAVAESGGPTVLATISDLSEDGAPAGAVVRRFAGKLAGWMADSDYAEGCPIATLLLELAHLEPELAEAGRASLDAWADAIAARIEDGGAPRARAEALGRFAISALEGAMIIARVRKDPAPVIEAGEEAARLIEAENAPRTSESDQ